MSSDPARPHLDELSFALTVSADAFFVDTARDVGARIGEVAGCDSDHAARLGRAIEWVLTTVAGSRSAATPREIDVAFLGTGRLLRVELSCQAGGEAGAFSLEEALTASGCAEALHDLVDRVEFRRETDRQICRLTRQIPQVR